MELLIATLAHTLAGRDTDVLARIRWISDAIRNAPGLLTSHFYRGRNNNAYYLILTTWEDNESWRKAQEHYNPKNLLFETNNLQTEFPEQWSMHYLWGYTRPIASPLLATVHLTTALPRQIESIQQGWIQGLRQHALQPTLAFAFLARGMDEDETSPRRVVKHGETDCVQGTVLLSFLSWDSDTEREDFYEDESYQLIHRTNEAHGGTTRVLALEPI